MEIVLIGLNHRSAPVEVREKVSFTNDQARQAAEELRARGILHETLVLSTCNRSEVYGVPPETARESAAALSNYLSSFHSVQPDLLSPSLYHHYDRYAVGKRVRSETELGTRPMSVASAGVKLAERIFGKLHERAALVLGAGMISEQVFSQLRDRNIARLLVMNRSLERADNLARQFAGKVIAWDDWESALTLPDVIVSSVSAEEPVLMRAHLEKAMAARGNRPLFVMDLGVPRNIDPAAASLYNFYLYNIDDLTQIVQQNRASREGEVPRAELIVDEHVSKFLTWQASLELISVVETLRHKLKADRAEFVRERAERVNGLTPEQREQVEALIDDLLEKMLLDPARRLQGEKDLRRKIQQVEAIRELFLPDRER